MLHGYGRVDDLAPTFLAAAGLPLPTGDAQHLPITGQSLLSMLRGEEAGRAPQVGGELFGQPYVRDGNWKLVSAYAPDGRPPKPDEPYRWRLYDLASDRGETRDLSAEQPQRVDALKAAWRRYVEWAGVIEPPVQP